MIGQIFVRRGGRQGFEANKVTQIQNEQALVNSNKQLIKIFEQKIKDRIAKVWGTEKEPEENLSMAAEPEAEYQSSVK